MISGNVPKHLVAGARTGFLAAMREIEMPYQRIAMTVSMDGKAVDLVDLGGAPMPMRSKTRGEVQEMIEKSMQVEPVDWDIIVAVSQNAIDDDRTGNLENRFSGAGRNFPRHINNRVFKALNAGDGTDFGNAYDGTTFFSDDHVDDGAHYDSDQDNEFTLALSLDNFETVHVAAQDFLDDQGEHAGYNHNLLVVHPSNERTAAQITGNQWAYDTANREINPYDGRIQYITSPELDDDAWHLVAANEPIKPLIVAMRRQPGLTDAWKDPMTPEGGTYYFKFFARYEIYYGDWRLAAQGQT